VVILDGGQFMSTTGLQTINYAFNITGNGWAETAVGQPFGAIRLEGGSIVTGSVFLNSDAGRRQQHRHHGDDQWRDLGRLPTQQARRRDDCSWRGEHLQRRVRV
jgi:hypothetical protein